MARNYCTLRFLARFWPNLHSPPTFTPLRSQSIACWPLILATFDLWRRIWLSAATAGLMVYSAIDRTLSCKIIVRLSCVSDGCRWWMRCPGERVVRYNAVMFGREICFRVQWNMLVKWYYLAKCFKNCCNAQG